MIFNHIYLVSPRITIRNQIVYVALNRPVSIECEVEAYPYAVHYWKRDGYILDDGDKYSINVTDLTEVSSYNYKFIIQLNISSMTNSDYGSYYCESKNVEGYTTGNITLICKYKHNLILNTENIYI